MKIAMVSEHASPLAALGGVDAGGQNVHVAALSTALARRGHQVTVYTRRDATDLPPRVPLAVGVDVVHIDAGPPTTVPKDHLLPFMGPMGEELARHWEAELPDIVHSHFWMSGVASAEAIRRLGAALPLAHTFHALGTVKRRHQGADDTSPPERAWLEPWVARSVDRIVATCSDEVRELSAFDDLAEVSVVPCGVDLDAFGPEGPVEPRRRPYRLVAIGRLVPRKGLDIAIEAVSRLSGVLDVELVIVGGGGAADDLRADPEACRLRELAERLGVGDRVELRGQVPRDDVPAIIRSADAVVCVPWYEPFGIVPLEAMACARPVIAARVGGLRDTVRDGDTGLHVPPQDPDALAAAVTELVADADRVARFGRAGLARVRRHYGWPRIAELTEEVYAAVLTPEHHLITTGGIHR